MNHPATQATQPQTFDNYVHTYWQSEPTPNQWIMIDLGEPTPINRAILKWGRHAAKTFTIQTSTDAHNWTDAYHTTQGFTHGVTDTTFPTTTARYLRVLITEQAPVQPRRRNNNDQPETPQPTGYQLHQIMTLHD